MKTKEELNALKEEVETVSRKLAELSEEELSQVTGGIINDKDDQSCPFCGQKIQHQYFYCHLMECIKKNARGGTIPALKEGAR
ncbi:MAG: bacteriocin [Eubacteriales bacterium]|nr:bacteriocin [Eubacteriales bacterium]